MRPENPGVRNGAQLANGRDLPKLSLAQIYLGSTIVDNHLGPLSAGDPFFLRLFIYFERETDRYEQGRGRDRIPSGLHTVSTEPSVGLKLMNREIMT